MISQLPNFPSPSTALLASSLIGCLQEATTSVLVHHLVLFPQSRRCVEVDGGPLVGILLSETKVDI